MLGSVKSRSVVRSEADAQSEPGHHVRACSSSGVQIREVEEKRGGHREPPIQSVLEADPNREQPGGIRLAKVRMDKAEPRLQDQLPAIPGTRHIEPPFGLPRKSGQGQMVAQCAGYRGSREAGLA